MCNDHQKTKLFLAHKNRYCYHEYRCSTMLCVQIVKYFSMFYRFYVLNKDILKR